MNKSLKKIRNFLAGLVCISTLANGWNAEATSVESGQDVTTQCSSDNTMISKIYSSGDVFANSSDKSYKSVSEQAEIESKIKLAKVSAAVAAVGGIMSLGSFATLRHRERPGHERDDSDTVLASTMLGGGIVFILGLFNAIGFSTAVLVKKLMSK